MKLLIAAIAAGALGYSADWLATRAGAHTWMSAVLAIGVFGVVYFGITSVAGIPEAAAFTRRLRRRR